MNSSRTSNDKNFKCLQYPKIVEQVFSFYILNILDFSEMSRPKPKPTMVKKRRKKAGEKVGKIKINVKFKF